MRTGKFQTIVQSINIIVLGAFLVFGAVSYFGDGAAIASAAAALGITASSPDIPATFNYEGTLRETDGSLTNGTTDITARIYGAAAGGSAVYTETFSAVNVRDGQFNLVLGDDPQGQDLMAAFQSAPLYVGLTLNSGSEIIPRERVHGVPWAINATNSFDGVPVGGIVDWWRPVNDDALFPIPDGFASCDGQVVSDPDSPLDGYTLPNFHNRFALGTSIESLAVHNNMGQTGGSFDHVHTTASAGSHNHLMTTWDGTNAYSFNSAGSTVNIGYHDLQQYIGSGYHWYVPKIFNSYTQNDGSHSHNVNNTHAPQPYLRVMKLCRLR